jgi:hypothetical protein
VDSLRLFVRLWAIFAIVILVYAIVDLRLTPELWTESHFSMRPDLEQILELRHWGGRLLREGAFSMLVGNALALGGLLALLTQSVVRLCTRWRKPAERDRISVIPSRAPTSVPPSELG